MAGLFTGANPANDATYLVCEYACVRGSTFCAVPVLPAELYPISNAFLPVPCNTTPCIIWRISAAVIVEITRREFTGWNAIICGALCGWVVAATILGETYTPSFAMVEIRPTSCRGVIPISWPMEMAAIETFDHRLTGFVSPRVSPGSSIPVCWPNPNERMYL